MRRIPTMMASASAAALAALAVTVAVPAIGDDGAPKTDDGFATCLHDNGLAGAPAGDGLKDWIGQRLDDPATKRALEVCAPPQKVRVRGPEPQELRACLKDHGVDVPGDDAMTLKRWLGEHGDEAANRDALKACDLGPGPMDKPGVVVACGKGEGIETAKVIPGQPATKAVPDEKVVPAEPPAANAG